MDGQATTRQVERSNRFRGIFYSLRGNKLRGVFYAACPPIARLATYSQRRLARSIEVL